MAKVRQTPVDPETGVCLGKLVCRTAGVYTKTLEVHQPGTHAGWPRAGKPGEGHVGLSIWGNWGWLGKSVWFRENIRKDADLPMEICLAYACRVDPQTPADLRPACVRTLCFLQYAWLAMHSDMYFVDARFVCWKS